MAVWRDDDPEIFKATVATAAEQLGVQQIAVEKDYWVCEVLRAIVGAHRDEVVFKGGTSLEKLRIVQRFSEDLDLLVVGHYGSKRAAKRAMKAMLAAAASTIGGKCTDSESGGALGSLHRRAYLELPVERGEQSVGLADPTAVLIELGQSGGPNPSLDGTVESLLARALHGAVKGDWDDLRPFAVTILHPGRTLLEKLLRVNNFVVDPARRDTPHGLPRIGRQFYDIWALLHEPSVIELLADKAQVGAILQSIFEVSEQFSPDHPVPSGGFAASDAFSSDGEFAEGLRRQHDIAMRDLYYGSDPPTFDDVIERVHACAELLNPKR
ncbi:MAG: nucleotidyl transferase AbiEii/AbiGii toxin family protein [Mycobacterium sp.]